SRQLVIARDLPNEFVIFSVMLEGRFADETAAFNTPMLLRQRERIFAASLFNFHALNFFSVSDGKVGIGCRPQQVTVEISLIRYSCRLLDRAARVRQIIEARHFATITKGNRNRIVRMAG